MGQATRPRLPWLAVVGLINAPIAVWFFLSEQSAFLRGQMSRGQIPGRDFINYWSGARLALRGRVLDVFDQDAYMRALTGLWGQGLKVHSFSYPPSILPLILWLGALPYGVALALWSLIGVLALYAAVWPYSRSPLTAVLILVSPAVAACVDVGQNGLITAALLIGGLRLVDRRPWFGGVLIGLVTFKPQLGLLIPLALAAAGRWKAIGGAAASALVLAAAGTIIAGEQGWALYLTRTLAYQRVLLEQSGGAWSVMTPSPLVAGLVAGLPRVPAWIGQGVVSAACALAVFLRFRRIGAQGGAIGGVDILLLTAAGFLAAPYSFNYDMPSLVLAIILAVNERPSAQSDPAWRWGLMALWSAPILMVLLGVLALIAGINWAPAGMLLTGTGLILIWRGSAASRAPTA